ncbi:MAG: TrkA family potassium uptake protein [bacterium]|nr:TrkA family potassium uptake protein [bacterium]
MPKHAKSFAVIGIGRFGASVAQTLCTLGHEVLAIDRDETRIAAIADLVTHAVVADTTDERALKRIGVRNFDCIIISVGDDIRTSILTTVLVKEQGAQYVIAKASDRLHARLLEKTGADKVVLPEHEAGVRLARSLVSGSIIDYLDLSDEYSINETLIPTPWVGKTLVELNVRNRFGVSVIAIRRGEDILVTLDPKAPLHAGDVLVMIGSNESLSRIGHGDV